MGATNAALPKAQVRELLDAWTQGDTFPVRLTVCLRRIDGVWTIVHEHHSVPTAGP